MNNNNFQSILNESQQQFTDLFESLNFGLDEIKVDNIDYDKNFDRVTFDIFMKNKRDGISKIYHVFYNFDMENEFNILFDQDTVEMLEEEGDDTTLLSYSSSSDNIKKYNQDFKLIHKNLNTILRRNKIKSQF